MKTITLTDEQFDTLFEYLNIKLSTIINDSIDYQDSQVFEDFENLIDVHTVLEDTKEKYEKKLEKARAKQPTPEW